MFWAAGAISNAIRGGQWYAWLNVDEKRAWVGSDTINEVLFGIAVFVATGSLWLALASMLAMAAGARKGWGDYIGALFGYRTENLQENKYIDRVIRPLMKYPFWWGAVGLSLRGLWWGVCLAVPFIVAGYSAAWWFLPAGASMPVLYRLSAKWMQARGVADWTGPAWGLGEIFMGAVLWSPLGGL
jgi:hypothetical protein